jgi:L-threonylcarbamoyladenylate synthase
MKRWTIDCEPSEEQLTEIAEALTAGGVLLLPTDTIYGLHAVAANREAVARIAGMKARDGAKPFLILAASALQLEAMGCSVPPILNDLWPAPLTAVLPHGSTTVAARVPDVAWLRRLAGMAGPLASTSANRSGESPVSAPSELARDLQNALDGLVDAGPLHGEPSAIVDFTGDEPRFIREGEVLFTQKLRKTLRKSL